MRSLKKEIHLLLGFSLLMISGNTMAQSPFDEKIQSLYRNTVPVIHSDEVLKRKQENENLIILDTRSIREFAVSHIQGAQFIDYDSFSPEDVAALPKDSEIIVYCSIGYRSERIGEKLIGQGYEDVKNLYGGIFAWKNTDHDVINESGSVTDSVHTYNRKWSQWLMKGIKVYE